MIESRQPRSIVRVNGEEFKNFSNWDVDNNRFYEADTFRCSFSVSAMPNGRGVDWWIKTPDITVEVLAGFPADPVNFTAGELTSLIYGRVDDLEWSVDGLSLIVTGRDLTGEMIDTKTSEKFPNKKASDIATEIAGKYGLTPMVTATTRRVGTYYDADHVRLNAEQTEWELLTWLAREESFQVYVKGKTLFFGPEDTEAAPVVITYAPASSTALQQAPATSLTFAQVKTLAKDITVVVRSWNSKKNRTFTATAKGAAGHGRTQEYNRSIPGLDQQQVQERAKQILAELTRHEMNMRISGPADVVLQIGKRLKIEGTGTGVDQIYYPDSINRRMSSYDGFSWDIRAKNHSPENEPTI